MTRALTAEQSKKLKGQSVLPSDAQGSVESSAPVLQVVFHPLPGLAVKGLEDAGGKAVDTAAAKKKKKKKKKGAGDSGAAVAPEKPVAPELTPEQRKDHVKTLIAEDKAALAVLWGITEDDERFILATTVEKSYKFMLRLKPEQRGLARKEHVEAATDLSTKKWTEIRQENSATLTDEDRAFLLNKWHLDATDPRAKLIFNQEKPEYFAYFKGLSEPFQKVVMPGQIRKQEPETATSMSEARARRTEAAKEAKSKVDAEKAAAQSVLAKQATADKHELNKKAFAEYRGKLKIEVIARLAAIGITDPKWAEEFATSADSRASTIENQPTAILDKQTKGLKSDWDRKIAAEQKKIDVTAELARHPLLKADTRRELKEKVLADDSLSAVALAGMCVTAFAEQRNPVIETWIRWMDLKMYRSGRPDTMVHLAPQDGFPSHFSVDEDGLTRPSYITDKTTPQDLLRALFRAPSRLKFNEAHVSLDSGVMSGGTAKNPHNYWVSGHELYFAPHGMARWDTHHTVGDIKAALDAARTEIEGILLLRAAVVLAANGTLP